MSRKIWQKSWLKLWPIRLCKLHLHSLRVHWVCVSWELPGLCQKSPTDGTGGAPKRQKSDPAGCLYILQKLLCKMKLDWLVIDDFGWFGNISKKQKPFKDNNVDNHVLYTIINNRWVHFRTWCLSRPLSLGTGRRGVQLFAGGESSIAIMDIEGGTNVVFWVGSFAFSKVAPFVKARITRSLC